MEWLVIFGGLAVVAAGFAVAYYRNRALSAEQALATVVALKDAELDAVRAQVTALVTARDARFAAEEATDAKRLADATDGLAVGDLLRRAFD